MQSKNKKDEFKMDEIPFYAEKKSRSTAAEILSLYLQSARSAMLSTTQHQASRR